MRIARLPALEMRVHEARIPLNEFDHVGDNAWGVLLR